jgi:hypothetical protein
VRNLLSAATLILAASSIAAAQAQTSPQATISHTTKAMHYRPQGGSVKVEFQSSSRMPSAAGEAKVEGKKTNVEIDAKFQGLEDSSKFGLEYLTYVLWAISPQGRPVNLGELALDHGRGHI